MSEFIHNFSLLFVQACIGSMIVAMALWGGLTLITRIWPTLSIQRFVWLTAQASVGVAFLLAWAPHSAYLSVLPTIHFTSATKQPGLARPVTANLPADAMEIAATSDTLNQEMIDIYVTRLALVWAALYVVGLCYHTARWVLAQRKLAALVASAEILDDAAVRAHPAFDAISPKFVGSLLVRETSAAVSPMLVGIFKTHLLLPQHLRTFSVEQQRLIVAHELTHLRRHDLTWLHVSAILQNLLWFNPVMSSFRRRLNWALELGCDQQVLVGRPQVQRQQYAYALVAQFKAQQTLFAASATTMAFGATQDGMLSTRIGLIRSNALPQLGWLGTCTITAILTATLAGSMLLQPAFGETESLPVSPVAAANVSINPNSAVVGPITTVPRWHNPVDVVRVNAFYGTNGKLTPTGRHGIDFAAKTDTPVLAVADGTVVASEGEVESRPQLGQVVTIQHADNLRSLYAHLDHSAVTIGDVVKAGQVIAYSGASGKVTGPHLHLEAFQGTQIIDPQRLLPDLDEHASKSALRARNALKMN